MAAVIAPLAEIEEIVAATDGYVALANVNSTHQVVLGGATDAVGRAVAALQERGHQAFPLPVSHAFHTEIVAPASEPLRAALAAPGPARARSCRSSPTSTASSTRPATTCRSACSTCSRARSPRRCSSSRACARSTTQGARVFVEVGPKHALQGFASDVLGDDDVLSLATNHPKAGDVAVVQRRAVRAVGRRPGRGPRARRRRPTSPLRAGATAQQPATRRAAAPVRRAAAAPAPPAAGDARASSSACSPSSWSAAAS